eukprot:m.66849 g.66849  ORF g.66849 m.66849 type:complete len:153 (-) comp16592_c0_seq1:58-516(-)
MKKMKWKHIFFPVERRCLHPLMWDGRFFRQIMAILCCSAGGSMCMGVNETLHDIYWFAKGCFEEGGTGSGAVCTDESGHSEQGKGAVTGHCRDVPLPPTTVCCQHANSTCSVSRVNSTASLAAVDCAVSMPPSTDTVVLGSCGPAGLCVPLS